MDGYYREYFATRPGAAVAFGADILRLARPFPFVLLLLGLSAAVAAWARRRKLAFVLCGLGVVPILGLADAACASSVSTGLSEPRPRSSSATGLRALVWSWPATMRSCAGVTFYTGRPTQVVGGPGSDMLFGFQRGDAPGVFLSEEAFRKSWSPADHVFILGGRDVMFPGARILLESPRSRLLLRDGRDAPAAAAAPSSPAAQ